MKAKDQIAAKEHYFVQMVKSLFLMKNFAFYTNSI